MEKGLCGGAYVGEETVSGPSVINLYAHNGLPDVITVRAAYREGQCSISMEAMLIAKNPRIDGDKAVTFTTTLAKLIDTEPYVTPSGLEVTIITSEEKIGNNTFTRYEARFVLNQASFRVTTGASERGRTEEALALLKEVLDAYE